MGYLRDQEDEEDEAGVRVFEQFPHEDIAVAFASPIKAPDEDGWPVGIVLFATRSPAGRLHDVVKDPTTAWEVFVKVQSLWLEKRHELCPLP